MYLCLAEDRGAKANGKGQNEEGVDGLFHYGFFSAPFHPSSERKISNTSVKVLFYLLSGVSFSPNQDHRNEDHFFRVFGSTDNK